MNEINLKKSEITVVSQKSNEIIGYNLEKRIYGKFKKSNSPIYTMKLGIKLIDTDPGNWTYKKLYGARENLELYGYTAKIIAYLCNDLSSLKCTDKNGLSYEVNYGIEDYEITFKQNDDIIFEYTDNLIRVKNVDEFYVNKNELIEEPKFKNTFELPIYNKKITHFNKLLADKEIREYYNQLCILEKNELND